MTNRCENCFGILIAKRHPCGKRYTNQRFCSGTCHQRHRKREAIRARKLWESWTRVYLPFENTSPLAGEREPARGGLRPARLGLASDATHVVTHYSALPNRGLGVGGGSRG